jgi:actin-like ATPase involved in cell morphogenesis/Tfp pilus assembly protein PilZ
MSALFPLGLSRVYRFRPASVDGPDVYVYRDFSRVFSVRWWRVFIDRISGKQKDESTAQGPRRRRAQRYEYEVKVTAKCSSWPKFVDMFTGDVSEGGLFVPTEEEAEIGEHVALELDLPGGETFSVSGTVVNVIDAGRASALDKRGGLGIRLDEFDEATQARFDELLEAARAAQPIPEQIAESDLPAVTKTGSLRTSAVLKAITDGTIEDPFSPAQIKKPPVPPPVPQSKNRAPAVHVSEGPIVGIDLGTTYTSIAAVQGKKVSILARPDGSRSTPSVIAFPGENEHVIGPEARARIATDPAHTVISPKRLLGRKFSEREVQTFTARAPYRTSEGPDGTTIIEIWGRQYAIPQLLGYILTDIRKVAEAELGERVSRAVVSVPISFDDDRVAALQRAGQFAQLDIVAVIDEPSAAALANRFEPAFGGVVGVYDFGGGTFDFSVVDVSAGDFRVMATAGDTWLGGDDFDQVLAEAAANQFWRKHKVDLRNQAVEWQRLMFACERAKRQLSTLGQSAIVVPNVLRTAKGMVDLELSIDRPTLKRACSALIKRSLDTCDEATRRLNMKPSDLSVIYLSGGTTYIPAVREALADHFKVPVRTGVPPEHAVCLGAAIHAAQLQFRSASTLESR